MKKLLVTAVAGLTLSMVGIAGAADLARPVTKAPPPPVPVYSWTGLYVGAGYGYGMFNADHVGVTDATGVVSSPNATAGGRGWFGTVLVGGDYQFSERIVAGVFADYDFSRIKGDFNSQVAFGFAGEMKQTSAWAIGGRIGWLVTPQILTYVNGGYTQARFSAVNLAFLAPATFSFGAQTYTGYFIGGGVEYMFAPGWFAKTEYRYADYRSRDLEVFLLGAPLGSSERIHPYVQTIRSELVYKFNWGGPVVAKY
jgi:outer membrane immunogenic protein